MKARAWVAALAACSLACPLPALAGETGKAPPAKVEPKAAPTGQTGPEAPQPKKPAPSKEDLEVMQNLELLENLDESSDLDLMQELTIEQ